MSLGGLYPPTTDDAGDSCRAFLTRFPWAPPSGVFGSSVIPRAPVQIEQDERERAAAPPPRCPSGRQSTPASRAATPFTPLGRRPARPAGFQPSAGYGGIGPLACASAVPPSSGAGCPRAAAPPFRGAAPAQPRGGAGPGPARPGPSGGRAAVCCRRPAVASRPGPGARAAGGGWGESAGRAMALGSAWKRMSWLYYQYLLVTALYMLEPWERTVFSILLPAGPGGCARRWGGPGGCPRPAASCSAAAPGPPRGRRPRVAAPPGGCGGPAGRAAAAACPAGAVPGKRPPWGSVCGRAEGGRPPARFSGQGGGRREEGRAGPGRGKAGLGRRARPVPAAGGGAAAFARARGLSPPRRQGLKAPGLHQLTCCPSCGRILVLVFHVLSLGV